MAQTIRFCTSADGVRLAFGVHGSGPPLVRVATWMTHLQYDWDSPLWHHWLDALAEGRTPLRYDERGSGVSDRDVTRFSIDAWVEDLEVVVDAAGLERFSLLGSGSGICVPRWIGVRRGRSGRRTRSTPGAGTLSRQVTWRGDRSRERG
ncbi:MAG: hypothetical protein GEU71_11695 [Actinobacteria bacterium]|nr:hypothetical protein [Actinomycetota bacterium]